MAKLIYAISASLDGYVADERGNFDWAAPDEEVHRFWNDLARPVGTHLVGRRMYETMVFWDSPEAVTDQPDVMRDFAEIWRGADKVVYSTTLQDVSTPRTRVERAFDPAAIREMKASAERDLSVGGPRLAEHALTARLVEELQLVVAPAVVGGGTRWLPDHLRVDLELLEERRFSNGMVFLRYGVTGERA